MSRVDGSDERLELAGSTHTATRGEMYAFESHIAQYDCLNGELDAMGELLTTLQSRLPDMHAFAKHLKRQSARNAELVVQRNQYQERAAALEELAQRQSERIDDAEVSLAASAKLQESLKEDLIGLQAEMDAEREANTRLRERDQEIRSEHESRAIIISKLETEQNTRSAELTRLRDTKNKLENMLTVSQRELSESQCSLAEHELKLDKLSKMQEQLVAEKQRSAEERNSLRRSLSTLETRLADAHIKNDRLKAESDSYGKRLASEKYSMNKDRDALLSQLENLRGRADSAHRDMISVKDLSETLRRERDEALQRLRDVEASEETRREELRTANNTISEMSLKYAADLLTLDQMRDENGDLRGRLDMMQDQQKRLYEFELQYKASENRAKELEAKLAEYVHGLAEYQAQTKTATMVSADDNTEGDRGVTKH